MSVAFNAVTTSSTNFNGATSSLTFSHTASGTNRVLLVSVRTRHSNNTAGKATGVTFDGVVMTLHREFQFQSSVGNFLTLQVWRLVAPTTSAANVVVTMTGSPNEGNAVALSFTNVNQTTPIEAAQDTSSSTQITNATATVTTVTANAMVVSFVYSQAGSGTLNAGPTQRDQTNYTTGDFGASATSPQVTPASVTHTWVQATNNVFAGMAVSLAPVAEIRNAANIVPVPGAGANTLFTISQNVIGNFVVGSQ